jgi:hypothetical protein
MQERYPIARAEHIARDLSLDCIDIVHKRRRRANANEVGSGRNQEQNKQVAMPACRLKTIGSLRRNVHEFFFPFLCNGGNGSGRSKSGGDRTTTSIVCFVYLGNTLAVILGALVQLFLLGLLAKTGCRTWFFDGEFVVDCW